MSSVRIALAKIKSKHANQPLKSAENKIKSILNITPLTAVGENFKTRTYSTKVEATFLPLAHNANSNDISDSRIQTRKRSSVQEFITADNVCPYNAQETAKPYSELPGPRPMPILGNTWRLIPYIGQYQISEFAEVCKMLYDKYGKIVRLSNLIGRPDLLFIYDADEIEKVYRREGPTPFRPSMPCLVKYKSEIRKDFFGDLPGVVGV